MPIAERRLQSSLEKGAMNILARSFAKILELRIITGGCVRQFHHIEEELPTKRQVNVFTESLNDWPSLADGSPAFEEQIVAA